MVNYSKRIINVRGADLSDFSSIFVGKMCVFVSRPMKIVTFLLKNGDPQNGLLIFLGKETHSAAPTLCLTQGNKLQLQGKTAAKELPDARLVKVVSRFPYEPPREKQKHRLCTLLHSPERHQDNRRNTARGASQPAKPVQHMPLPLSTISKPNNEKREQDENRLQDPGTPSRRKMEILPKPGIKRRTCNHRRTKHNTRSLLDIAA